jgi:hypothetical protein
METDTEAETQAEAAFLLGVGARVIEDLERKLDASEKEKAAMALLLDEKEQELKASRTALNIAGAKIVELNDHNAKLTNALTTALTLIDYTLGELRNNNIVPSAALTIAHQRFTQQMQALLPDVKKMSDPIPSPSELKPGQS